MEKDQPQVVVPMAVQIVITFNPATGQISVNGPLDNCMLCYGMIEMAREVIQSKGKAEPKSQLFIAQAGLRG